MVERRLVGCCALENGLAAWLMAENRFAKCRMIETHLAACLMAKNRSSEYRIEPFERMQNGRMLNGRKSFSRAPKDRKLFS